MIKALEAPRWLGGGLQEVAAEYTQVVVSGEGCIYSPGKLFPWAEDCLRELKECGIRVVVLQSFGSPDLLTLGLREDMHFDAVLRNEYSESEAKLAELLEILENAQKQSERTLVVGECRLLVEAAQCAGLEAAFVCSGKHSSEFGLSAAPAIDVPANGGHFVEPEGLPDRCKVLFRGRASPSFAISCFSFSAAPLQITLFADFGVVCEKTLVVVLSFFCCRSVGQLFDSRFSLSPHCRRYDSLYHCDYLLFRG